jgi:vesicle-fusing ATPase
MKVRVAKCPSTEMALTNLVFVAPAEYERIVSAAPASAVALAARDYVRLGSFVYRAAPLANFPPGSLALNGNQRKNCFVSLNQEVEIVPFGFDARDAFAARITLEASLAGSSSAAAAAAGARAAAVALDMKDVSRVLAMTLADHFLSVGQEFAVDLNGRTVGFRVLDVAADTLENVKAAQNAASQAAPREHAAAAAAAAGRPRGAILLPATQLLVSPAPGSGLRIEGGSGAAAAPIFRPDWNFDQMGIGGLDKEFADVFRRAFASRTFPNNVVKMLGIKHVKGILLYGPPGTGKTLTARQIGNMLSGRPPKKVKGPEILDKFVGGSEEKVRALFKDAEAEYALKGDASELHIVILDELDAICGQRGTRSGSTGVMDTVVNQFLASMDGVDEINNILLIGMTNRRDLIDEALLRPGRLEVQIEIGLPDEAGRLQILRIHTAKQRENGRLAKDVDLQWLSEHTKNFTGADIQGLVGSAASFAMQRHIDPKNPTRPIDPEQVLLTMADFRSALDEVQPLFGIKEAELAAMVPNGIIPFGEPFAHLLATCRAFVEQVRESRRTPLLTLLLEGSAGCGKTALASKVALDSNYPFAQILTAESLIGYSEAAKIARIRKLFDDAWKSPLSVVVLDDLERIVEYVPIGPRFSNLILQTLMVLVKQPPPTGRRLLVLGTTSQRDVVDSLDLLQVFNVVKTMPNVSTGVECAAALRELKVLDSPEQLKFIGEKFAAEISIKRLILLSEMAAHVPEEEQMTRFFELMNA